MHPYSKILESTQTPHVHSQNTHTYMHTPLSHFPQSQRKMMVMHQRGFSNMRKTQHANALSSCASWALCDKDTVWTEAPASGTTLTCGAAIMSLATFFLLYSSKGQVDFYYTIVKKSRAPLFFARARRVGHPGAISSCGSHRKSWHKWIWLRRWKDMKQTNKRGTQK